MTSVNVSTVTNTITVTDGDNSTTVVTVPVTNTVTATTVGPQGPAGVGYLHQQTSSSTTWVINHNLGFRPAIELFDSGSQEIDGDVAHPSVNQAIITLSPATTGTARLT